MKRPRKRKKPRGAGRPVDPIEDIDPEVIAAEVEFERALYRYELAEDILPTAERRLRYCETCRADRSHVEIIGGLVRCVACGSTDPL